MRSSTRWAFLMAGVLCLSFARSTAAQTWTPEDYQPLPADATLVIGYEESPDFRVFGYVPRDKGSLGGSQDLFGFRHGDTVYFVTHLMATRELPDSDGTWENLQIALYTGRLRGRWVGATRIRNRAGRAGSHARRAHVSVRRCRMAGRLSECLAQRSSDPRLVGGRPRSGPILGADGDSCPVPGGCGPSRSSARHRRRPAARVAIGRRRCEIGCDEIACEARQPGPATGRHGKCLRRRPVPDRRRRMAGRRIAVSEMLRWDGIG